MSKLQARNFIVISIVAVLLSCKVWAVESKSASIYELITQPGSFVGSDVLTEGYLKVMQPETELWEIRLYPTKDDWAHRNRNASVRLYTFSGSCDFERIIRLDGEFIYLNGKNFQVRSEEKYFNEVNFVRESMYRPDGSEREGDYEHFLVCDDRFAD